MVTQFATIACPTLRQEQFLKLKTEFILQKRYPFIQYLLLYTPFSESW